MIIGEAVAQDTWTIGVSTLTDVDSSDTGILSFLRLLSICFLLPLSRSLSFLLYHCRFTHSKDGQGVGVTP